MRGGTDRDAAKSLSRRDAIQAFYIGYGIFLVGVAEFLEAWAIGEI